MKARVKATGEIVDVIAVGDYINENIDFDDFHFRDCDETFNNDLFVDAFRKAMEE